MVRAPAPSSPLVRPDGHDACLVKLRMLRSKLQKGHLALAEYILANPAEVPALPIGELAARTATSEAGIVRLCQRLGYPGYADLKLALAREIAVSHRDLHQEIDLGDDLVTIARKTFASSMQTLQDTLALVDAAALERVVAAIAQAERVVFVGLGGSGTIAVDACYKLIHLGVAAQASTDPAYQAMICALLGPRDVLVAVSYSGQTRSVVESAALAKEAGAVVVAITAFGPSPLAKVADVSLATSGRSTELRDEPMAGRISQLALLDTIFIGVALRTQPTSMESLQKARRSVLMQRL